MADVIFVSEVIKSWRELLWYVGESLGQLLLGRPRRGSRPNTRSGHVLINHVRASFNTLNCRATRHTYVEDIELDGPICRKKLR